MASGRVIEFPAPLGSRVRSLADLQPGDHLCCLYSNEEEHRAVLMPFLVQGLELGQKVVYIAEAHRPEVILDYLEGHGLDLPELISRGRLSIVTPVDTYLREGAFDPDGMISFLRAETDRTVAAGYPALRVTGEMTWALSQAPGANRLIEYEAKLNQFFPGSKCLAICQYDVRRFEADTLLEILCTHPIAVVGTTLYDNFYYIRAEEFLSSDVHGAQLRNWVNNLAGRRQIEESLRSARDDWELTFNSLSDAISIHDTNHNILYCNEAFHRLFPHAEPGRAKCYEVVHGTSAPPEECPMARVLQTGATQSREFFEPTIHRDLHLRTDPVFDSHARVARVVHVLNDITALKQAHQELQKAHDELEQRVKQRTAQLSRVVEALQVEVRQRTAAEEKLTRVNRALRALSEANQALVRATSEAELLQRCCEVIVQAAGYRLAWVGFPERDAEQSVRPVAQAGVEAEYLKTTHITWADTPRGRGPTGRAIRSRHVQVVQNVHKDSSFGPWREEAVRRGYGSTAAFPLLADGELFGALNIYAAEVDAFGPAEIELLTELANDLAYGIHTLRIRQAHQEAEAARDRLAAILEATTDFVGVADLEGHVLQLNQGARRLVGFGDEEDVTHLRVPDMHPQWAAQILLRQGIPAAIRQGMWRGETALLTRQGAEIPVSQVILAHRSSSGKTEFLSTIIRDISERKRAEEALRQSEARYRGLVENSTYGIFQSTPEGKFLSVNPALVAMLGYSSKEQVLTLDIASDVFRDPAEHTRFLAETAAADRTANLEFEWKRQDNKSILVRIGGRKVAATISVNEKLASNDQPGGFEGIVEDITERRALEKQLTALQKFEAIGKLAGGIAHDFNNVIGAVLAWAEMGREEAPPGSRVRSHFEKIANQAERAAGLTRQLLAFARRQVLQPRSLSLNQSVTDVTNLLQKVIGEQIELKLSLAPDLPVVRADPAQLEQVLMNLCLNARDAMPEGGQLTVETGTAEFDDEYCRRNLFARPGRYVLVTVTDTGVGMSPETLEHIFEPFFSTKEPGHGTGLGLATVYGIVQQHEGLIHVYSEPGYGSTFRVYLPIVAAATEPCRPAASEPVRGGSETILVAEDHEGGRQMVCEILTRLGYTVLAAANGEEAVRLFQQHRDQVALLLFDVVMPQLSGPDAFREIEAIRPGVPVIFATGYSAKADLPSSLAEEHRHLIQKPYSPTALARKIREVLDACAEKTLEN